MKMNAEQRHTFRKSKIRINAIELRLLQALSDGKDEQESIQEQLQAICRVMKWVADGTWLDDIGVQPLEDIEPPKPDPEGISDNRKDALLVEYRGRLAAAVRRGSAMAERLMILARAHCPNSNAVQCLDCQANREMAEDWKAILPALTEPTELDRAE